MRIAQGDSVIVIAGKDKGKKGTVLRVFHDTNRVIVGGINLVTKHVRKTSQSEGRKIRLEHSLSASNVMVIDPKTGAPTRIRYALDPATKRKVRIAVKSGTTLERSRLNPKEQEQAVAGEVVKKEQTKSKKSSATGPFWKKSSSPAGKADAGPAQATVTHARSAGRGS